MSVAGEPGAAAPYTFATWVFELHVAGVVAADDEVRRRCEEVAAATVAQAGDAAADALVERIRGLLGEGAGGVGAEVAGKLYGDRAATDMGEGTRDERIGRIRKYQFARSLPWMARIVERGPDGVIRPSWILVERVTDMVHAMDPNPWNDVDEERQLPVGDFQVLWELDGCTNLYVT